MFFGKTLSFLTDIVVFVLFNMFISAVDGGRTEEGLEYMFAANYIGHFLLTMLLLGKYK